MGGDSTTTVDQGRDKTISTVHPEILRAHILTRLDGQTLASAACASAQLHSLSTEEKLWRDICNDTWPSTADPRVRHLISAFPAGHRSFYSDSFLAIDHIRRSQPNHSRPPPASKLISAVDIRYQNRLILSKVLEIKTGFGSPFRVDLLDPKETVPMPVKMDIRDDECGPHLEENLTVSWILLDPTRTRAANVSTPRAVSTDRNWLTDDIELRYLTVLSGAKKGELVQCGVVVTCGRSEGGGELHVREVSFHVEDMEGKKLSWEGSLVILQEAMENGKRRKVKRGEERERYKEYLRMKRERRERKQRRERGLELVCIAATVAIFVAFWLYVAVKILQLLRLC